MEYLSLEEEWEAQLADGSVYPMQVPVPWMKAGSVEKTWEPISGIRMQILEMRKIVLIRMHRSQPVIPENIPMRVKQKSAE